MQDEDIINGILVITKSLICFCRDLQERFRFATIGEFKPTLAEAQAEVPEKLNEVLGNFDKERAQGDEKGPPIDFFTLVKPEGKHHDKFLRLCADPLYSPAKGIVEPMMRWNPDTDGNYVEQFQTVAFDQRLWELYLFAVAIEANMVVMKEYAIPDVAPRVSLEKWRLKRQRSTLRLGGTRTLSRRRRWIPKKRRSLMCGITCQSSSLDH